MSSRFYVLFLFFITVDVVARETYEVMRLSAEQAFQEGRLLRAQFRNSQSRIYLQYAADHGNANAAFLYAMELANYRTTIRTPPDVKRYLVISADSGNRHAMRWLYQKGEWLRFPERERWKTHYLQAMEALELVSPAKAWFELAGFWWETDRVLADEYLQRAVAAEYPQALMLLAEKYEQGDGWFFFSWRRQSRIQQLYEQAAASGFIPAIRAYIVFLEQKGNFQSAYNWRERAIAQGDINSLAAMAMILSGERKSYQFVKPDPIRVNAYFWLYLNTTSRERLSALYDTIELRLADLTALMTDREKCKAEELIKLLKKQTLFYNHDLYWDI